MPYGRIGSRLVVLRRFDPDSVAMLFRHVYPALKILGEVVTLSEFGKPVRARGLLPTGLRLRHSSGADWKDRVQAEMSRATVIVIDVSHYSDSLAWEMSVAGRLYPRKVVTIEHRARGSPSVSTGFEHIVFDSGEVRRFERELARAVARRVMGQ